MKMANLQTRIAYSVGYNFISTLQLCDFVIHTYYCACFCMIVLICLLHMLIAHASAHAYCSTCYCTCLLRMLLHCSTCLLRMLIAHASSRAIAHASAHAYCTCLLRMLLTCYCTCLLQHILIAHASAHATAHAYCSAMLFHVLTVHAFVQFYYIAYGACFVSNLSQNNSWMTPHSRCQQGNILFG